MPENRTRELLDKLVREQCTPGEKEELFELLRNCTDETYLEALLEDVWKDYEQPTHRVPDEAVRAVLQAVDRDSKENTHPGIRRIWFRLGAVAAVLLLLTGVWSLFSVDKKSRPVPSLASKQGFKHDIAPPQRSKAVLTLANGKSIVLDHAGNGTLATQGNVQVQKKPGGNIVYTGDRAPEMKQTTYNTLTVPRGSRPVRLSLADGTKVWLDVASSITYPVAFTGRKRVVTIRGEAYFEVARNAGMPFIVKSGQTAIRVLGTHFNVNAYSNESSLKVTLLDGSVKVAAAAAAGNAVVLKPGEQARVNKAARIKVIKKADIEEAMAWKNDRFVFTGIPIQAVMRQVARWYDVDVSYEGDVTNEDFVGFISRYANVSALLKMLEQTKVVQFEIEGRRIVVKPYGKS